MRKLLTLILILCTIAAPAQMRGGALYDPGAARKNLSNVDASATPSMKSITLSDKVQAAWADILGDIYASGAVKVSAGTAAAPAYSFSTDPDTGIYSAGADTIGFSAGGSQVATISSAGLVGISDGSVTPAKISSGYNLLTSAEKTQALVGSSAVDFSARNTKEYGWSRLASGTFTTADYFNLASGASKTIDFTLSSNVGVACEVAATMQFSSKKQAFGVWYSTFHFTAASGIDGLVHQQTVDLDDSQLLTVAWSWATANTLRVTFTNAHTETLYEVTPSIRIISRRAGDIVQ